MRDIRPDLNDRLASIQAEKRSLQSKIDEFGKFEAYLNVLIAEENRRWQAVDQATKPDGQTGDRTQIDWSRVPKVKVGDLEPFSQFVFGLVDELGPSDTTRLAQVAVDRGYPFGTKNPRRSIHFALVGLSHQNLVEKHEGKWRRLPEQVGGVVTAAEQS